MPALPPKKKPVKKKRPVDIAATGWKNSMEQMHKTTPRKKPASRRPRAK